jgi:hypothetical protein
MPDPIPVLKEDTIQLVVHAIVRGTQYDDHIFCAVRRYPEPMNRASSAYNFAILGRLNSLLSIYLDGHTSRYDAEILVLKRMEMSWWPRRLEESCLNCLFLSCIVARGRFQLVSLPKAKASTWRWFEKLGDKSTAKSTVKTLVSVALFSILKSQDIH